MFRRARSGAAQPLTLGVSLLSICLAALLTAAPVNANPAGKKAHTVRPAGSLGGFVKDKALARVLGETLFRDTVEVMSDSSAITAVAAPGSSTAEQFHDNSAVGQVARVVLARRSLDKYLWLIRQAYDDSMWKGGDRALIEQHFPLIWRTSIMVYESTLGASPHRVRVCVPGADGEDFDCHDEVERARMVPIPAQAPLLGKQHQPNIG